LEAIPLTANGKVDRAALPAPGANGGGAAEYRAPRNELEEKLCRIWEEVLGLEQVGIDDDFFQLGGDSIVLIEMAARTRAAGIEIRPTRLAAHATIATLVEDLAADTCAKVDAGGPATGRAVLQPIQRWFFELPLQKRSHWNQALMLALRQPTGEDTMRRVAARLIEHHDALRLRFRQTAGEWTAEYAPLDPEAPVPYERIDMSAIASGDLAEAIASHAARAQASLDIERGPLVRFVEFATAPDQPNRLLIVVHHLVVDGVSWRTLLTDLHAALRQAIAGAAEIGLGPRATPVHVWSERLHEYAETAVQLQAELPCWLSQTVESSQIPPQFAFEPGTVASERELEVLLDEQDTEALLRDLPETQRTQMNDVLVAALGMAVRDWTGSETILINLEGHGREPLFDQVDVSRTCGWFTSMFPVRVDLPETDEPIAVLQSVKARLQQIRSHGIGYGILRYLSPQTEIREGLAALERPPVVLNYLGQFDQLQASGSLFGLAAEPAGPMRAAEDPRPRLLELNIMVREKRLRCSFAYSRDAHDEEAIGRLAGHFIDRLRGFAASAASPAAECAPMDFPLAQLDDEDLDAVLTQMMNEQGAVQ
jgi:non-ribosomal peptide synthase protein (TIGR01720 family)